jgi:glutaredoxin 3
MMLTIYSKTVCPYCVQAKNYLKSKKIEFREVNIEEDPEARAFIQDQGHRTVPQIYFMGKVFVEGGWTGLSKMNAQEILDEIELRSSLLNQSL